MAYRVTMLVERDGQALTTQVVSLGEGRGLDDAAFAALEFSVKCALWPDDPDRWSLGHRFSQSDAPFEGEVRRSSVA